MNGISPTLLPPFPFHLPLTPSSTSLNSSYLSSGLKYAQAFRRTGMLGRTSHLNKGGGVRLTSSSSSLDHSSIIQSTQFSHPCIFLPHFPPMFFPLVHHFYSSNISILPLSTHGYGPSWWLWRPRVRLKRPTQTTHTTSSFYLPLKNSTLHLNISSTHLYTSTSTSPFIIIRHELSMLAWSKCI